MASYLLRLKDDELEQLRDLARAEGCSVSTLLRRGVGLPPAVRGRPKSSGVRVGRRPSATPEPVDEAAFKADVQDVARKVVVASYDFRCPDNRCDFVSGSGAARCPHHGRAVVAV